MISRSPSENAQPTREAMTSTLRCFAVLELLGQEPYDLSLSAVCSRLSLPKGSAHRLMATLVESGFVEQDAMTRRYRLTGKALWVGAGFLRSSELYRAGFQVLQDLSSKVEGMVHLGAWDGDAVLYLHTVGPPNSLYLFADTGERRPLHATGLGKAMLAYRPEADVERTFQSGAERFTEKTIVSLEAMRDELERVRSAGWAFDDEEGVKGLCCVAAPIWDRGGMACGAVSTSGPATRFVGEEKRRLAARVREGAVRISVQLGYRPRTANIASLFSNHFD